MSSLPRIISGHVKELTGQNQELFETRKAVCDSCPGIAKTPYGEICTSCGCRLQAKLRIPGEQCPLDKWLAIV